MVKLDANDLIPGIDNNNESKVETREMNILGNLGNSQARGPRK